MAKIRLAQREDEPLIRELEKRLELEVAKLSATETWVIEEEGKIIGLAKLTDLGEAYFLSSVGVVPERRGEGLAKQLLQAVLVDREKDVYLYTIIPDFYYPFGFEISGILPFLPPRDLFSCHSWQPESCLCMVRRHV
jgi:N-acetylglutamate synthase-like GNAT family acetyltransferase